MLHWSSCTTGNMCYLCIADVFNGDSIGGINGYWKTNGSYTLVVNSYNYTVCISRGHIGWVN